jgi:hypothetical protein
LAINILFLQLSCKILRGKNKGNILYEQGHKDTRGKKMVSKKNLQKKKNIFLVMIFRNHFKTPPEIALVTLNLTFNNTHLYQL